MRKENDMSRQKITTTPEGLNSVNPVIISEKATDVIEFIVQVFGGKHDEGALAYDHDGTIIHSQVYVDNTTFIVGERKPGWRFTPAFTQVYVVDVEAALERAKALGAKVITEPTDYVGVRFSRVQDPQGNIWWIWAMLENYDWEAAFGDGSKEKDDWKPTREAVYVRDTLVEAMEKLAKD